MSDAVGSSSSHRGAPRAETDVERTFELSPALLAVAGFDGYLRRFNPAFEVFGYSPEELISRPWTEFAHPDDRERMVKAAASLERGHDVVHLENRVVCRDGSLRWVEWSTRVVPEEGLFYVAGRDVTESRRFAEEQAALRRVATLVAREAAPDAVFAAVAREVGEVLRVDATHLGRYEPDGTVSSVAQWGRYAGVPIAARFPLEGDSVSARVLRTGRPARMDSYQEAPGVIAATVRGLGIRVSIGVPISVERRTWGVMIATSKRSSPFPAEAASRLRSFTELVAAAISNASARDAVRALAEEQAALRRVATLVARQTLQEEVFRAIAEEIGRLLPADSVEMIRFEDDGTAVGLAGWGAPGRSIPDGTRVPLGGRNVTSLIFSTQGAARLDDYGDSSGPIAERVTASGVRSAVGTPIMVEGRLWGAMIAASRKDEPLPAQTEARLGQFTELMATAIANALARSELARVAEEQAALRRVATLVAQGTPAPALFANIVEEVGSLLHVDAVGLASIDDGKVLSPLAMWAADGEHPAASDMPIEPGSLTWDIVHTGASVRKDDWGASRGATATLVRDRMGMRSSVAVPIKVGDEQWGAFAVHSKVHRLPPDTEVRLERFAALMSTALTNAQTRGEVSRLLEEQAALRRVATLVAQETPQADVFRSITEEIGRLLAVEAVVIVRYEEERFRVIVAGTGAIVDSIPVGRREPLGGEDVVSSVHRTGRPARIDDYGGSAPLAERALKLGVRSAVGTPIRVEGRLWGAMVAISREGTLPAETETRVGQFTALMATAIANSEARAEATRLADEQAALRRVATLVAQGAPPTAVFDAVTAEVVGLMDSSQVTLSRFDGDVLEVVAQRGMTPHVRVGDRYPVEGENATTTVLRTGRPARVDDFGPATGTIGEVARRTGVTSIVAAPVTVDGRTWGLLGAVWSDRDPPPEDTEARLAGFAELLDTAIANADARENLTASRARVLAAGDEARRRVVRDLHDGAQQRLVHTVVTLKLTQRALREGRGDAEDLLAEALGTAERATAEVRELAHGILPAVLTRGGLRAGVDAFVSRLDLPVDLQVSSERLPPDIEASAYFIVAEALTNVVKHARATQAAVRASVGDGVLTLEVRDDGVGGADPEGHGLLGVADRVDALGGGLRVAHGDGGGTVLTALLPLPADPLGRGAAADRHTTHDPR
jgi:PAS domain S-box-containing protein